MAETKPIPNQKLRHERERRAWSQQDVADKVGTTPLNVGRWERSVTMPGPYFRQKLCEVFEKTAQELGLVHEITGTEMPIAAPLYAPSIATSQEAPPLLWNVPYNRNPLFTGREEVLAQIRLALTSADQALALVQPQAISGLGGIGKTQTAVEYAYRYRDSFEAIFWARADSAELLSSDYLLIAALLTLPQRNEQDQSLVVKAVLNWFDTRERWLLILDNADDLETISAFIPPAGKGHVLLTTRAHSTGTIAGRVEMETMGLEEGTLLLLRRAKLLKGGSLSLQTVPETVRSQAQAIVEAVDGLPLALDQAGAYIEGTGCSLSDYLKFYKTRRNRLLRMRGESATGHPEPVATTWSLSFEKVERANPAAAELLRLCAFLHPDEIPESMIIEGGSKVGPILQPVAEDEMELNEAIGELRKYSLVKRDPEKKILNIHRLVQAVIKDGMDRETQREWAVRTVWMVGKVFPEGTEFETWPTCQKYLPHAQVCIELIAQWDMNFLEAIQLLNHTGAYLGTRGRYKEAEPILQRALSLTEQVFGPDDELIAEIINNLGVNYWMLGQYEQTVSLLQRAIAIQEKNFGPVHTKLAETLNNLGVLYNAQGKHSQAIPLYERAIAIWEQVLKLDDPLVAYAITNLAVVYDDLGRYEEAEQLYKRSLDIRQRLQGMEHPEVGTILNNLAVLYQNVGRYEEATPLLEHALTIVEKTMGMEHPRRGTSLDNLARNYQYLQMYDQAEATFKEALVLRQRVLGPEHANVAFSLDGLASLYRLQGKYEQAEPLFQEALAIREKTLGEEHPLVANPLYGLGMLYLEQGMYEKAELSFQRSLKIREQAFGPDHPDVAQTLHGLAQLYARQDLHDRAEPLFQRVLAIRQTMLGEEHPETITALQNYTTLLRKANRETEAAEMESHVQAIRARQG